MGKLWKIRNNRASFKAGNLKEAREGGGGPRSGILFVEGRAGWWGRTRDRSRAWRGMEISPAQKLPEKERFRKGTEGRPRGGTRGAEILQEKMNTSPGIFAGRSVQSTSKGKKLKINLSEKYLFYKFYPRMKNRKIYINLPNNP